MVNKNYEKPDFQKYYGKDVPILSGAIHYFRVHPEYWRDRLQKLRACGYNTVETYVPWNLHEPKEGEFNFEGFGDIVNFVKTAQGEGLRVIIRPGPYICAEWELGGLPAWLNQDANMKFRSSYKPYLEKVTNYFNVLIPKLTPFLLSKGGPIIAMQIENEYGSYGYEKEYLIFIKDLLLKLNVDCMLFTSDGWEPAMLDGGILEGIWATANFGSKTKEAFKILREYQPEGPDMCCEYWCGWFDHWGENHHTRDANDTAKVLEEIVKGKGSVNMYMFHGGTNFGFWNGANVDRTNNHYQPTTTSYDYDALLSEAGDITPKYEACKKVLEKYFGKAPDIKVSNSKKKNYGKVTFEEKYSLWDNLGKTVKAVYPLTMEELQQEYGYVLYRTTYTKSAEEQKLKITGLKDRAVVFIDGKKIGTLYRNAPDETLDVKVPDGKTFRLDILVECMGRVNYGHDLAHRSGITGTVLLGYHNLTNWEMYTLPFDVPLKLNGATGEVGADCPVFYRGKFNADERCDTFLDTKNFKKGIAFINGFNLGRYWEIGPVRTMYIPAPLLKQGENELIVFETDECRKPQMELVEEHVWLK